MVRQLVDQNVKSIKSASDRPGQSTRVWSPPLISSTTAPDLTSRATCSGRRLELNSHGGRGCSYSRICPGTIKLPSRSLRLVWWPGHGSARPSAARSGNPPEPVEELSDLAQASRCR